MTDSFDFLYPRHRYYGNHFPETLLFNAKLREFSQQVNYICGLETNGKLSPDDAYEQILELWKQLKQSKKQLGIGQFLPGEDGKQNI